MTANDILRHIYRTCDWVDPAHTVDRIIVGDGNRPLRSALVTWISSRDACREAMRRGVDLLVTHEPTFWNHWDERATDDAWLREKQREIEASGLVIVRLHDSWDRFPEIGIPYAWARFLEIDGPPVERTCGGYQLRYDIASVPAGDFARRVAARTAMLGEPTIQFVGDPAQIVQRVGIGTGCACDPAAFARIGCDLAVVCDDGTSYWGHLQRCADFGLPAIRVNHGTSEEPGMATLAHYLARTFPELTVEHLPHRCQYSLVSA